MTRLIRHTKGLVLLLVTILCELCCSSDAACYGQDAQALLAFKQELLDPNGALATWKAGTDCCNWNGVDCGTAGRVVNLTISVDAPQRGGNLTVNPSVKHPGTSLGTLSALLNLFVGNVNFSAPLPPELGNLRNLLTLQFLATSLVGPLPSTLGQLTKLTRLNIDGASFSPGAMPSSFCNLASLETLEIFGDLTSLPPCLPTGLKKLQELRVGNNKLKGNIPVWLTYFPALTQIDLHGNQFTGTIPAAFGNMKKLQYLLLSENQLQGRIPPELGNLASLVSLDLGQNLLTGPIPRDLSRLKNLVSISCQQNFITGPLPPELGTMPKLQTLDFFQNNITGGIPPALANIGGANVYIVLSHNDLTGPLPPQLGKLRGGSLQLDHNKLTGGIPASYANLNSLAVDFNQLSDGHQIGPLVKPDSSLIYTLSASGNRFSGAIPSWLASFDSLNTLDLSQNKFTGQAPIFLGELERLFYLNLSHNAISKPLPPFLRPSLVFLDASFNEIPGSFPLNINPAALLQLDLSHNQLSGPLSNTGIGSATTYPNLITLHASYNKLTGSIPSSLGNASSLFDLDLSHNQLSGAIPASLASLSFLQFLDLSHNLLSGRIPAAFSGLEVLQVVRLAWNNLSGPIPQGSFWRGLPVSSFKPGNNGLCGAPLAPCAA